MRTLVRETVFKTLFTKLFNSYDEELFELSIKDFTLDDKEFAKKLYKNVKDNFERAIKVIDEYSIGFKSDRIYNVDKCLLVLGITELDYFPETSSAIIINEIVNLASKYSTENSMNFINGILGKYAKDR